MDMVIYVKFMYENAIMKCIITYIILKMFTVFKMYMSLYTLGEGYLRIVT